jgi:HEAT repeat protein
MKTLARRSLILILALAATVSLRLPGGAGWFAATEDEQEHEAERYEEGREALDEGEWEEARTAFDEVARLKGSRADAALYWKAYALGKLRRLPEALSTLESLTKGYPGSQWVDDAKALAVELKQTRGKPVTPEEEDPEELKLMALNGLLHTDPDQALPMLERLLTGSASRRLKEQALFVLVQTGSPKARTIVENTARGRANPSLQRKAVELLGIFGGEESSRVLHEIYTSTSDESVRRQILQAYMVSGDAASLLAVARDEKSPELRGEAISLLGAQGAEDELVRLYETERTFELKERILQAFAIAGSDRLIEAARGEKDPRLRVVAVRNLGIMGQDAAGPALQEIYRSDGDVEVRRAVLEALMISNDARALIAIARAEKNPVLRRAAVEKLSVMGSKEATAYLMELLEE